MPHAVEDKDVTLAGEEPGKPRRMLVCTVLTATLCNHQRPAGPEGCVVGDVVRPIATGREKRFRYPDGREPLLRAIPCGARL